jgi:hypothetical protein
MRKARRLKGWKLYFVVGVLGYPIMFFSIWLRQILMARRFNAFAHYSHMDVSIKQVAVLSALANICLLASVIYTDLRKHKL